MPTPPTEDEQTISLVTALAWAEAEDSEERDAIVQIHVVRYQEARQALARQTIAMRTIARCLYDDGMSQVEIADRLRVQRMTVAAWLKKTTKEV